MGGLESDTIGGFNGMIAKQKEQEKKEKEAKEKAEKETAAEDKKEA